MKAWIPLMALGLAISPLAFVHPVRVIGCSMEPALRDGTVRMALRAWCAGRPTQGEIWMVDGPEGPAVKRLIGLPGDHLEQRNGELVLNGKRMVETYLDRYDLGDAQPWDAGEGYLLLGDNRRESRDSRAWGPLPRTALRAKLLAF
jgi:signal peptidase I